MNAIYAILFVLALILGTGAVLGENVYADCPCQLDAAHVDMQLTQVKVFWESGTAAKPVIIYAPVALTLQWEDGAGAAVGYEVSYDATGFIAIGAVPKGASKLAIAPYDVLGEFDVSYVIDVPEAGSKETVYEDGEWVTLTNTPLEYYNGWMVNQSSVYAHIFGPNTESRPAPTL